MALDLLQEADTQDSRMGASRSRVRPLTSPHLKLLLEGGIAGVFTMLWSRLA